MIAKIKKYFRDAKRREHLLRQCHEMLEQMAGEAAYGHWSEMLPLTTSQLADLLLSIGVRHLRAVKAHGDRIRAARDLEERIKAGPRPTYQEAQAN